MKVLKVIISYIRKCLGFCKSTRKKEAASSRMPSEEEEGKKYLLKESRYKAGRHKDIELKDLLRTKQLVKTLYSYGKEDCYAIGLIRRMHCIEKEETICIGGFFPSPVYIKFPAGKASFAKLLSEFLFWVGKGFGVGKIIERGVLQKDNALKLLLNLFWESLIEKRITTASICLEVYGNTLKHQELITFLNTLMDSLSDESLMPLLRKHNRVGLFRVILHINVIGSKQDATHLPDTILTRGYDLGELSNLQYKHLKIWFRGMFSNYPHYNELKNLFFSSKFAGKYRWGIKRLSGDSREKMMELLEDFIYEANKLLDNLNSEGFNLNNGGFNYPNKPSTPTKPRWIDRLLQLLRKLIRREKSAEQDDDLDEESEHFLPPTDLDTLTGKLASFLLPPRADSIYITYSFYQLRTPPCGK